MGIYIIGFFVSTVLLYFVESRRSVDRAAKMLTIIALLIPCFIAGFRAETVGTDVQVYVRPLFDVAHLSETITEYYSSAYSRYGWDYTKVADLEPGYTLLVFLVQKIFNSMPVLLFAIQALTVIPIYKGLRAFDGTQPVWLGMVVYYLMFYNQTLNMMRQWIAMAFLFYGFQFLVKNKPKKYFLAVLVGMLFHNSAVIGVAIFAVYQLVAAENAYNRTMKAALLILIGFASIFCLEFFVDILDLLGLRYGNYIDGSLELMPNQFLYRIPVVLLLLLRWRHLKRTNSLTVFFFVMTAYDILASQLVSIFSQSGRIGIYFSEYYMLVYPAICSASSIKFNKKVMSVIVLCFLCIYWWYIFAYSGAGETVPYVSVFAQ